MFGYTWVQLIFFFIIYCFFGWIIESTYVSVRTRKVTNRGFMRGPVIPIYGSGAMMMLFSTMPFKNWPLLVFVAGTIGCSVLEFFTGVAMEAIFKVRYWDYSYRRFNIKGHICLFNSLCWGVLSLAMTYFVHKPIETLSTKLPSKVLNITVLVWSVIFIVDLTLAFKAAFDLRNLIIKLEKAKDEMRLMTKRLDVMIAYANESFDERKIRMGETVDNWAVGIEDRLDKFSDSFDAKIDSLTDGIEERFIKIKKAMEERPQNFAESMKAEFYELRGKFSVRKEKQPVRTTLKDWYMRSMIKGNPSLSSYKFKDTVDHIKKRIADNNIENEMYEEK